MSSEQLVHFSTVLFRLRPSLNFFSQDTHFFFLMLPSWTSTLSWTLADIPIGLDLEGVFGSTKDLLGNPAAKSLGRSGCPLHFLPTLQHPVQAHLGAHHLVDQVDDQDHRIWVKHLYKLVVKTNTFIFPCRHSCV